MRSLYTLGMTLLLVVPALALTGRGGYEATEVVTGGDLAAVIQYDVATPEVLWEELEVFGLGTPHRSGGEVAVDAGGDLLLSIWGFNRSEIYPPLYTGIVRRDALGWHHVVQDKQLQGTGLHLGTSIRTFSVSPVTAGLLTAGHAVLVRHHIASETEQAVELWSVDPATGHETFVFGPCAHGPDVVAIDPGTGTIYAGDQGDFTISSIAWDAGVGAYVETTVPATIEAVGGITIGPDGYLYTVRGHLGWYTATKDTKDVYRIDPATGGATYYGSVRAWTFIWDWAWDADGRLWMALRESGRKGKHYVTKLAENGATNPREAISESAYDPRSLATGLEGKLYVVEWVPQDYDAHDLDALYELAPAPGGGGGKPPKK